MCEHLAQGRYEKPYMWLPVIFFGMPIVFEMLNMARNVYWANVMFADRRTSNISCYRNYHVVFDDTDFFYVCRL